ncbi:hypothetical protein JXQ70_05585 [bacterium]|nr:hypothetical protein [bacterium]
MADVEIRTFSVEEIGRIAEIRQVCFAGSHSSITQLGYEPNRHYLMWLYQTAQDLIPLCGTVDGQIVGYILTGHFANLNQFIRLKWSLLARYMLQKPQLFLKPFVRRKVTRAICNVVPFLRSTSQPETPPPILVPTDNPINCLDFAVLPEYRKYHISFRLAITNEKIAAEHGFTLVHLGVRKNTPLVIKFWEVLGYQVTGESDTSVRLQKTLA